MERVAALDLGSNSFLCLIVEASEGRIKKVLHDQVEIVRLGQDVLKTKKFHPEALKRADETLQKFKLEIDRFGVKKVLAMATAAARDVSNAQELMELGKKYQIPIEIIPGDKEAEITFRGATEGIDLKGKTSLLIDIGGGSTELIVAQGQKILGTTSLPLGCVRLKEAYQLTQPVDPEANTRLVEEIQKQLENFLQKSAIKKFDLRMAVAGTPTELARAELGGAFDAQKIDGFILTRQKLEDWSKKLGRATKDEIIQKFDVNPGRADIIFVGVQILLQVLINLNESEFVVSTKGVRYGVALELLSR